MVRQAPSRKRIRRGKVGQSTVREPVYVMALYVAGTSSRSSEAVRSVKEVCAQCLEGRHKLEIIDICQHPALAREAQIIAVPTLIRKLPTPLRRLIGSMADRDRIMAGLNLEPRPH